MLSHLLLCPIGASLSLTEWVAEEKGEERSVCLVSHSVGWEGGEFSFLIFIRV